MLDITKELLEKKGFVFGKPPCMDEKCWHRTIMSFDEAFDHLCEIVDFDTGSHSEDLGFDFHGMDLYMLITYDEPPEEELYVWLVADYTPTSYRHLEDDEVIKQFLEAIPTPEEQTRSMEEGTSSLEGLRPSEIFKMIFSHVAEPPELDTNTEGRSASSEPGMNVQELVTELKKHMPKPVDYAEMVGAPIWAYRCSFVYDDPVWYLVEDAITKLLDMEKELTFLKKDVVSRVEAMEEILETYGAAGGSSDS